MADLFEAVLYLVVGYGSIGVLSLVFLSMTLEAIDALRR